MSEKRSDQALANLNQQYAYRLMGESKFADAEMVINGLPDNYRINMLVELANRVHTANKEQDHAYAVALIEAAHGLVGDHPPGHEEMSQLMQVVSGFAQIEPSRGLDILERLTPQVNELSEAAAVLWTFQDQNAVRDGEFVITQGSGFGQLGINGSVFGQFARSDLDRTVKLIDSLSRPEMRVALRLQMLSSDSALIMNLPINGRGRTIMVEG